MQFKVLPLTTLLWRINHYRLFNAKSSLHIHIKYMIWFGCVLWLINHCRLFNAKSSLHIHIKYMIWFGCVLWLINHCRLFNVKSSLNIYIKYIIFIHIWSIIFLNEPELNGFTYFNLIWIILFTINHLFAHNLRKLAILIKGDSKAPFSIATTPRCREGCYSIPRIAPLYPWSSPHSA